MNDTIAAIATPPGRGGVGVIRVSGPASRDVCLAIVGKVPTARTAVYTPFLNHDGAKLDEGLVIFFANPNSFTGEDVLELQGHGGPVVLDMLLRRVLSLGVRLARAGEFSERAFLNNKMDLLQSEAVAQLINASSEQAAKAAMRSLQGDFSTEINKLVEGLIRLRLYVEAAIDFPEEEIDFVADAFVAQSAQSLLSGINEIEGRARQGALLSDGVDVVIAGRPNAGKSTLLNALTGQDTAIVTPIAGTTRDVVRAQISIDGVLLNVFDTAGLRVTDDVVEQAGIARTHNAVELADILLLVLDGTEEDSYNPWDLYPELMTTIKPQTSIIVVCNKIDHLKLNAKIEPQEKYSVVYISAHTGLGLDLLREHIKSVLGASAVASEGGVFLARRRHLDALVRARDFITNGMQQLKIHAATELLAEELKHAQLSLSEITGEFSNDALLGRIFSEFCIGK